MVIFIDTRIMHVTFNRRREECESVSMFPYREGGAERTVNWDAYDEAYAAAPVALPDVYLTPPSNCTFGCIPLRQDWCWDVSRLLYLVTHLYICSI